MSLQLDDPQLIEIRIDTGPFGKFVAALTATVEVSDHPALDEVIDLPELPPAVTHLEVVLPARQMLIELLDQFTDRLKALLWPSQFPDLFPFLFQRFNRWKQVQVPPRSTLSILLVAEAVAQEIQGRHPPL